MAYFPFNYYHESTPSYALHYGTPGISTQSGDLVERRDAHGHRQIFLRAQQAQQAQSALFSSNSHPYLAGGAFSATSFPQPSHSSRTTSRDRLSSRNRRESLETVLPLARSGHGYLQTAGIQAAASEESLQDRLNMVPSHKKLLINISDIDPQIRSVALDLLVACSRAEQEFRTWEPSTEMTDRLLQPISRPTASTGLGSRRGLEAYQCLWSECGRRISKRANAISHLLSHAQYKPFLCNQCPHYPRFRYKHDYARHCRGHTFSVPQVNSHRYDSR